METLLDLLKKIHINKLYFIVTLFFLAQFSGFIHINLSKLNSIFIFAFMEKYQDLILILFYALSKFNIFIVFLFGSRYLIGGYILPYFKRNFYYNIIHLPLSGNSIFKNIIFFQIFTIELFFILYKVGILSYTIINYHFWLNDATPFNYHNSSSIYDLYLISLVCLQTLFIYKMFIHPSEDK